MKNNSNFDKVYFNRYFSFMNHAFGVIFQKTLPNSSSNVFLLEVFQFIAYNIFVIHFELIFIYWSKFDFLLMESILQYQLLKIILFLH